MEKQQAQQFKTGDVVTWTSQAAGSHVTKTGLVVGVVAPRKRPDAIFEAFKKDQPNARGGGFGWTGRPEESYLVAVAPKSDKAKVVQVYWPRSSALKAVSVKPKPAQKAARKKKKAVPAKVPSKKKAAKAVKKK